MRFGGQSPQLFTSVRRLRYGAKLFFDSPLSLGLAWRESLNALGKHRHRAGKQDRQKTTSNKRLAKLLHLQISVLCLTGAQASSLASFVSRATETVALQSDL